jgi:hypothetical protein
MKREFAVNPSLARVVLFDPSQAYSFRDINVENIARSIARSNRKVIKASMGMVALLNGCETWREIEFARMHSVPVYGILGEKFSPVAIHDFPTYRDIEEFIVDFTAE